MDIYKTLEGIPFVERNKAEEPVGLLNVAIRFMEMHKIHCLEYELEKKDGVATYVQDHSLIYRESWVSRRIG